MYSALRGENDRPPDLFEPVIKYTHYCFWSSIDIRSIADWRIKDSNEQCTISDGQRNIRTKEHERSITGRHSLAVLIFGKGGEGKLLSPMRTWKELRSETTYQGSPG